MFHIIQLQQQSNMLPKGQNWPTRGSDLTHWMSLQSVKIAEKRAATRGEVPRGSLAARTLCICCVWISHISDHPEHPYGHVIQKETLDPSPPSLLMPSLSLASPHLRTCDPPAEVQREMPVLGERSFPNHHLHQSPP